MPIKTFESHTPVIHPDAYVDDQAYVSGQTRIGAGSSVWPMVVIRGDINHIHIGQRTNIQDGSVLHVTHGGPFTTPDGFPLIIGDEVTVGHNAVLHACTIGNRCLIGMSATVMDGVTLEENTMIGAGSLVPPHKTLESGYLWVGNPVKRVRPLTGKEKAYLEYSAHYYCKLAQRTIASATSETG